MILFVARASLMALLLFTVAPAMAQTGIEDGGPGEIELWRMATAGGSREDYQIYLQLYPHGRFASLAKIRLETAPSAAPATAPSATAPHVAPSAPPAIDFGLYRLEVTPAVAAAKQLVTVRSFGLLPPSLYDLIVVVPAGAPDVTPDGKLDESQLRVKSLANLVDLAAGAQIPALTTGRYEVRYLSRQYNPDGRLEVVARAQVAWK